MYARIDQETSVAELIPHNPQGRYHPSLQWVEVPAWLEPYIDNQFWYDGEALNPPTEDTLLQKAKARQRALFATAFKRLEQRAQRPQSAVLTALMDAGPPPEPDADFLWQLESIKAENRLLLAQLEATKTREAAELIHPWLPAATAQRGRAV
ncbi:MAG: hypothetical protein RRY29_10675 [Desulfovibrionaceae bacterium]